MEFCLLEEIPSTQDLCPLLSPRDLCVPMSTFIHLESKATCHSYSIARKKNL